VNAAWRAQAILADPSAEWAKIEEESGDPAYLLTGYVALLALVPAIFGFIGACVVGAVVPGGETVRAPILEGLFGAVFGYVAACAAVLVLGLLISLMAPFFGARQGFDNAFKLAVYSYTPVWLAGIFLVAPGLRFLVLTGFYGAYLLWRGLPPLMKAPEAALPLYTAAVVACGVVLTLVIAEAEHTMFGLSVF
jgi:hypothetical protein